MKAFAPVIVAIVSIGLLVAIALLYERQWQERRLRKAHAEERRRQRELREARDAEQAAERVRGEPRSTNRVR